MPAASAAWMPSHCTAASVVRVTATVPVPIAGEIRTPATATSPACPAARAERARGTRPRRCCAMPIQRRACPRRCLRWPGVQLESRHRAAGVQRGLVAVRGGRLPSSRWRTGGRRRRVGGENLPQRSSDRLARRWYGMRCRGRRSADHRGPRRRPPRSRRRTARRSRSLRRGDPERRFERALAHSDHPTPTAQQPAQDASTKAMAGQGVRAGGGTNHEGPRAKPYARARRRGGPECHALRIGSAPRTVRPGRAWGAWVHLRDRPSQVRRGRGLAVAAVPRGGQVQRREPCNCTAPGPARGRSPATRGPERSPAWQHNRGRHFETRPDHAARRFRARSGHCNACATSTPSGSRPPRRARLQGVRRLGRAPSAATAPGLGGGRRGRTAACRPHLKSSSASLGAIKLSRLCAEMESMAGRARPRV